MFNILKLVILLLLGWIVYVTLFGTADERERRNNLLGKAGALGKEIVGVFQHEAKKFNAGEYDAALKKLSEAIQNLQQADKGEFAKKITELESKRKALLVQLEQAQKLKAAGDQVVGNKQMQDDLKKLSQEIDELSKQMTQK